MLAFQKYCQLNQNKIMGFTIFMGFMAVLCLIMAAVGFAKDGVDGFIHDPMNIQSLIIPFAFLLLLLIHKIFHLYIQGFFFNSEVLKVYRAIAKIAITFALIIKPAFFMLMSILNHEPLDDLTILYLAHADFLLAIVAYALNLVASVTKLSREIEQENELTI